MSIGLVLAFTFIALASVAGIIGGWGSWGWLLVWPAISSTLVALGYMGLGARVFGKRADGSFPWWAWLLHAPYLLLFRVALFVLVVLSREEPYNRVAGRYLLSRRLKLSEFSSETTLIFDCTAEFPALHPPTVEYIGFPTLDGAAPDLEAARPLLERIIASEGDVVVHCAAGHGRSSTVLGALLIMAGEAKDVDAAVAMMKAERPGVRLSRAQRRALEAFATRC